MSEYSLYPICATCHRHKLPTGYVGTLTGCTCTAVGTLSISFAPQSSGTVWYVPTPNPEEARRYQQIRVEREKRDAEARHTLAADYYHRLIETAVPKKWRGGLQPFRKIIIEAIDTIILKAEEGVL